MGKIVPTRLVLDEDVAALVTRIGATDKPENCITEYTVTRASGRPTFVTVVLIADEQFSDARQTG